MILYWNFIADLSFIQGTLTFKNGKTERMGDLCYSVQRNPVLSIKIAVLNFVKEGIDPIQTHRAGTRSMQRERVK